MLLFITFTNGSHLCVSLATHRYMANDHIIAEYLTAIDRDVWLNIINPDHISGDKEDNTPVANLTQRHEIILMMNVIVDRIDKQLVAEVRGGTRYDSTHAKFQERLDNIKNIVVHYQFVSDYKARMMSQNNFAYYAESYLHSIKSSLEENHCAKAIVKTIRGIECSSITYEKFVSLIELLYNGITKIINQKRTFSLINKASKKEVYKEVYDQLAKVMLKINEDNLSEHLGVALSVIVLEYANLTNQTLPMPR